MELKTINCKICGEPTSMTGTKLCNRCWELKTKIQHDPDLAEKILSQTKAKKGENKMNNLGIREIIEVDYRPLQIEFDYSPAEPSVGAREEYSLEYGWWIDTGEELSWEELRRKEKEIVEKLKRLRELHIQNGE